MYHLFDGSEGYLTIDDVLSWWGGAIFEFLEHAYDNVPGPVGQIVQGDGDGSIMGPQSSDFVIYAELFSELQMRAGLIVVDQDSVWVMMTHSCRAGPFDTSIGRDTSGQCLRTCQAEKGEKDIQTCPQTGQHLRNSQRSLAKHGVGGSLTSEAAKPLLEIAGRRTELCFIHCR